jgi:hypothetical protein
MRAVQDDSTRQRITLNAIKDLDLFIDHLLTYYLHSVTAWFFPNPGVHYIISPPHWQARKKGQFYFSALHIPAEIVSSLRSS